MIDSIGKYRELGLEDFKLRDLDDLYDIYEIKPEQTEGFNELPEDKKDIFSYFIVKFYNSWGLDARLNLKPVLVKEDGPFMKFDFDYYGMSNRITIVNKDGWR
ncbi:MAG: hypothetical protein Q4P31_00365 [Andreesenia angusta]|nr:hypothetical protein [Andreesenia angusta]